MNDINISTISIPNKIVFKSAFVSSIFSLISMINLYSSFKIFRRQCCIKLSTEFIIFLKMVLEINQKVSPTFALINNESDVYLDMYFCITLKTCTKFYAYIFISSSRKKLSNSAFFFFSLFFEYIKADHCQELG